MLALRQLSETFLLRSGLVGQFVAGVGGVGVWGQVSGRGLILVLRAEALLLRAQCRAATDWLPASSSRHGHRYTKPAPPRCYTGQLGTEHTGLLTSMY